MTDEFKNAFTRAQALQRRFNPDYMNSFSIAIKYDSYYEEYMEIELRTDNDKFFISTLTCVYEEDYTMIKKVIFVSLLDVISIPSGNEHSVDITDFQLKHDFFRALQADDNIVRVNILGYDKNQVMYSSDITFKKMVSVITYEIAMYADKAVVPYCSTDNIDDTFVDAAKSTESIEFLKDKSNWLIIGNDGLADKFGVDNITMDDFVNGELEEYSEGAKTAEKR